MNKKRTLLVLVASFYSLLSTAHAYSGGGGANGIKFGLSYMMLNTKENPTPAGNGSISGTDSDSKQNYMDLKLGKIDGALYYGLIYSTYGQDSASLSQKRTLLGLSIGYHSSGFFIDGSYFLQGKFSDKLGTGSSLDSPNGFGVDFGYDTMVASNFYVGVQVSYKDITFQKYTPNGGSEVSTSWKQNELYPMLNLGFIF